MISGGWYLRKRIKHTGMRVSRKEPTLLCGRLIILSILLNQRGILSSCPHTYSKFFPLPSFFYTTWHDRLSDAKSPVSTTTFEFSTTSSCLYHSLRLCQAISNETQYLVISSLTLINRAGSSPHMFEQRAHERINCIHSEFKIPRTSLQGTWHHNWYRLIIGQYTKPTGNTRIICTWNKTGISCLRMCCISRLHCW